MSAHGAVTNNAYEMSGLSEEGQIIVVTSEYAVRHVLELRPAIIVFHSLKQEEAQVLALRLPKDSLRSVAKAERDNGTGDLRDKESKQIGMELEMGPIEMRGREAFVTVLCGTSIRFVFELERGNPWRIRKVHLVVL